MVTKMKQIELKKILEDHAAWLEDENTGNRADFSDGDWYGVDMHGVNLRQARLGANLENDIVTRQSNLQGANLSQADLFVADLRGADLSGAYLRNANLTGANLSSVINLFDQSRNVRTDLSGADLTGANLTGALSDSSGKEKPFTSSPSAIFSLIRS